MNCIIRLIGSLYVLLKNGRFTLLFLKIFLSNKQKNELSQNIGSVSEIRNSRNFQYVAYRSNDMAVVAGFPFFQLFGQYCWLRGWVGKQLYLESTLDFWKSCANWRNHFQIYCYICCFLFASIGIFMAFAASNRNRWLFLSIIVDCGLYGCQFFHEQILYF